MTVTVGIRRLILAKSTPASAVFHNPVKQGFFETDVMPGLLALDPLMPQDLRALSQKFLIKRGFVKHSVAFLGG